MFFKKSPGAQKKWLAGTAANHWSDSPASQLTWEQAKNLFY
jgi:hypothetical protein